LNLFIFDPIPIIRLYNCLETRTQVAGGPIVEVAQPSNLGSGDLPESCQSFLSSQFFINTA